LAAARSGRRMLTFLLLLGLPLLSKHLFLLAILQKCQVYGKKQKISQLVKERNNANVGDPNAALILSNGKSGNLAGRECEDLVLTS